VLLGADPEATAAMHHDVDLVLRVLLLRIGGSSLQTYSPALMSRTRRNSRSRRSAARRADSSACRLVNSGSSMSAPGDYPSFAFRSLSALPMTDTELSDIAALASIGLRSQPRKG
jgi:hypothetical protein